MTKSKLPRAEMAEFPFPLREGQLVYLKLPLNLSKEEVKILADYMLSLTLPDAVEVK